MIDDGHGAAWKEHFDRGMAAGSEGDLRPAARHFEEAISVAPDEPYPHYELGYTLWLLGDYKQALTELRRTNELCEGFFLVQTEIYICEGVLSGQLNGQSLAAVRQLQQLTDTGQAQGAGAVSLSRDLIKQAPTCALGYYYLGKALMCRQVPTESACQTCRTSARPDESYRKGVKG